jgi:glutamine synthetase
VRAELRCPDPSANPYLAVTIMLAAALDGIERKLTPPAPLNDINVYELSKVDREELGISELPGSLADALEELDRDVVLKNALGPILLEAFLRAKWAEWEEYITAVTDWEVKRYLQTA